MKLSAKWGILLAGLSAGIVNGLFGAGGGMILVPLLAMISDVEDNEVFPTSVSIILPICIVSLLLSHDGSGITAGGLLPYLLGSAAGGILCGFWGQKIPTLWLHRLLGGLILWGGVRYLC